MRGIKNLLLFTIFGLSQCINAQEFINLDSATDKNYIIKGALSPKTDIFYHLKDDFLQKVEYVDEKSRKVLVSAKFNNSKLDTVTVLGKYYYRFKEIPKKHMVKYAKYPYLFNLESNKILDSKVEKYYKDFFFTDTNNTTIYLNGYNFAFQYGFNTYNGSSGLFSQSWNREYYKAMYFNYANTVRDIYHKENRDHFYPGNNYSTYADSCGFHLSFNKKGELSWVLGLDGFETNYNLSIDQLKQREFAGLKILKDIKFDFTIPNLNYDTIKNHTKDGYLINYIFHKNYIKVIQLINALGQKEIEVQFDDKNLLKRIHFIQDSIILPCTNGYLDRFLISKENKNTSAIDLVKLLGPHEVQLNNYVLKTINNSNTLIFEKDSITFVVDYYNYGLGNTNFLRFKVQGYQETIYLNEGRIIETEVEGFKTKGFSREFYHPRKRTKPVTQVRTKFENIYWSHHTIKKYIKRGWNKNNGFKDPIYKVTFKSLK